MTHHWKKTYSHETVLILYEHKSKMKLANNTNMVIVLQPMSTTQGDMGVGGKFLDCVKEAPAVRVLRGQHH